VTRSAVFGAWLAAIALLAGCASDPAEIRLDIVTPTTFVVARDAGEPAAAASPSADDLA
jgi:hypothetical protein